MNKESQDINIVNKSLNVLIEHFDTVQVFASRAEDDGLVNVHMGRGNWFARYGQVKQWTIQNEFVVKINE